MTGSKAREGGVTSVADAFAEFTSDLARDKPEAVAAIAEARNGFEGWLKVEFYAWLRRRYDLGTSDVGMEYLLHKGSSTNTEKRCDLWVRGPTVGSWHFIELKVPFANTNRGKMLRFGGTDLWHMMNIDGVAEGAASGNAILVGVDFDEREWKRSRAIVLQAAGVAVDRVPSRTGVIGTALRWDVWSHDYGTGR